MTASTIASRRVRDFVTSVAAHFEDLPERERAELLEDLEGHLLELAAEGEEHLEAELANPGAYAEELRRSAGLPERRATVSDRLLHLLLHLATWPRRQASVQAVLSFLPQLRPAWWLARAWAVVTLVAFLLAGGGPWQHVPVPGGHPVGLVLLVAAMVVSVRAGQRGTDDTRAGRAADVLLGAVTGVIVLALLVSSPVAYLPVYHDASEPRQLPMLRHPDGEPITNLYLFDLDGNPVEDVLVYDGLGRPVEIGDLEEAGFWQLDSHVPRDRLGNPVRHMYPLEQYEVEDTETGEVRRPRPAPDVLIPEFTAPPGAPPRRAGVQPSGLRSTSATSILSPASPGGARTSPGL